MAQNVRNVLIISEYIAPAQSVASIRWTKLAKYLSLTGRYRVSVLTNEKDFEGSWRPANHYLRDPLLERDMSCFDQYFVVPETRALRRYYRIKQKFAMKKGKERTMEPASSGRVSRFLRTGRATVMDGSHIYKDFLQRKAAQKYIDSHPEIDGYDVVISSYSPAWPHWVARQMKKRNTAMVWIADYRDPCYTQLTPRIFSRRHKRFAATVTRAADRIATINKELLPLLYLSVNQRSAVISNGFDPAEAEEPQPSSCFSLLYTGTLYPEGMHFSDLGPVFSEVRTLINEGCMAKEDISLQYAGNTGDLFLRQASAYNLSDRVLHFGYLSRDAAAKRRKEAAVLLINTWNTWTERGIVTGKIYEYMLARKPILAVCSGDLPGSRIGEMIRDGGLGFCYEEPRLKEDGPKLKEWLREAYLSWKSEGSVSFVPNEEYVQQFGHDRLARIVDQIIDEEARALD